LNTEIKNKSNELNETQRRLKSLQENPVQVNTTEVIEKKKKSIEEKLKQNKRLSFEEFLILYGEVDNKDGKDNSNIR